MRRVILNQLKRLDRLAHVGLITTFFLFSQHSYAAVAPSKTKQPKFFDDLSQFHSSLNLPLSVRDLTVKLPEEQIKTRLSKFESDPRIEPLQVTVDPQEEKIMDVATRIAKPNRTLAVANYLKENFSKGEAIPGTPLRLVTIDETAYQLLNQEAFESLFSKVHHEITVNTSTMRMNAKEREKFISQLSPFLSTQDLKIIRAKIENGTPLNLDKELLPPFAKQKIAGHTIYRGPNCFHAALAFQNQRLASSSLVNVRRETGYHQDMLNYDELWRVLKLSFYEIDPRKNELQYGDMIVFFEAKESNKPGIDFKTLRHASTYLLGGYVFAKGSKSANSPYLVRTLGEEWKTWSKYTQKLGVKVFRRNLKHVTNPVPADPIDWVY
jgi:hypothetical protein